MAISISVQIKRQQFNKKRLQVLNFPLEGPQPFFSSKAHCYLYSNLTEGTTAKTQGTTAIAVGAVGYLEAGCFKLVFFELIQLFVKKDHFFTPAMKDFESL